MDYASRAVGLASICVLIAAAWFSIKFARADIDFRRKSPEAVEHAAALAPLNTQYLTFCALQMDYAGQDPIPLLLEAAKLNPLSSAPRIRLGVAAEVRGDVSAAEKWLIAAAQVDRQFEARWTLVNFYFRQSRPDDFWNWMRQALAVSYGDRTPAFDLCWRVSQKPEEILDRAIPDRHEVVAAYLIYLIGRHHLDAAVPVSLRLASMHDSSDRPILLGACDSFLDAQMAGAARDVWQAAGFAAANGITNGDFANPPLGQGFDWRLIPSQGVTHTLLSAPAALRIATAGTQPESCVLLRQTVSLRPGSRYLLHWKSRTQGFAKPSGLRWQIANGGGPIESSEDWREDGAAFAAPGELAILTLVYQRPEGQPRAEGSVELSGIRIVEARP